MFEISNFKSQISGDWTSTAALIRRLMRRVRSVGCLLPTAICLLSLTASNGAFAQSCPYCYANAAAQAPGMLHALRAGILVMMLPCLAMFVVIFGAAYRRRNSFNAEDLGHWEKSPTK